MDLERSYARNGVVRTRHVASPRSATKVRSCRTIGGACLAVVVGLLLGGCGSRRGSVPAAAELVRQGWLIPATFQQACAEQETACTDAHGPIPAALKRPLHFPLLRPGERCPATPGTPIGNGYFAGVALGSGEVRPLIASVGDLRHGVADLDPAETPGWREFKTLWFSVPRYQGPFVIRAERLDKPGPVRLGGSGELPASATPIVVPPGPTLNSYNGWRTVPSGMWAKAPGCYAWQVDGLTFTEIIVVKADWLRVSGNQ
jgi:hypothetical protein